MLHHERNYSGIWVLVRFGSLLYHTTVRKVVKKGGNPLKALAANIMQSVMLILVFYIMFTVFGRRASAIRGDFLMFLMTGIFMFMTHTKTMGAVVNSEGPASPIMQHAPMTTFLGIASSALSTLYLQLLSMLVILFVADVAFAPVVIEDPGGVFLAFLLAWFSGLTIGLIFLSLKPLAPSFASIGTMLYSRANMIASGKMFAANNLPAAILPYFAWNPLFHTIDQARGAAFINYTPHNTSIMYPVYFSGTILIIGMMGEFFARQHASASKSAR